MLLEELSNAPGVSGNEGPVRHILLREIKDYVDETRVDTLGNLIAVKRAHQGMGKVPKVMLAAHMDEVGVMIVHIEGNGFLRFRLVGGIDPRVLLSKPLLIGEKQGRLMKRPYRCPASLARRRCICLRNGSASRW